MTLACTPDCSVFAGKRLPCSYDLISPLVLYGAGVSEPLLRVRCKERAYCVLGVYCPFAGLEILAQL